MSNVTSVDLLIIGGGPAGLATASTFARLKRPLIVYDSHSYRNARSNAAHTLLGFEGQNPASYREKARSELERDYSWVTFRDDRIVELSKAKGEGEGEGTMFTAKDGSGNEIKAKKVVLATGLRDVLPDVPGMQDIWGTRAVHCVFCHGTETYPKPIALFLNPKTAHFNPMIVDSFVKLWGSLKHPEVYILTHGVDADSAEGKEKTGLGKYTQVIKNRGYKVISSPLESVDSSSPDHLTINFTSHPSISVGAINLLPEAVRQNPHTSPFLSKDLLGADLTPMGTLPIVPASELGEGEMKLPPAMGDDPRTPTKGLFWAGNSGNMMGNINLSVLQGQNAGFMAGEELGKEEAARDGAAA